MTHVGHSNGVSKVLASGMGGEAIVPYELTNTHTLVSSSVRRTTMNSQTLQDKPYPAQGMGMFRILQSLHLTSLTGSILLSSALTQDNDMTGLVVISPLDVGVPGGGGEEFSPGGRSQGHQSSPRSNRRSPPTS